MQRLICDGGCIVTPDKRMLQLEGHLQNHDAPFYFSQDVTLPAHVAAILGCTLLGLFLCSQDKSGAKDRVLCQLCLVTRCLPGHFHDHQLHAGAGLWLISPTEDVLGLKTLRFASFYLQLGDCVQAPLHLFVHSLHGLSDTLFHRKMSSLKLRAWCASYCTSFKQANLVHVTGVSVPTILCLVQVRTRPQCCSFLHQLLICVEEHLC